MGSVVDYIRFRSMPLGLVVGNASLQLRDQLMVQMKETAFFTIDEDDGGTETALWALELLRAVSSTQTPPCNVHVSQDLMIQAMETCTSLPRSIVAQIDRESDDVMLPAAREKWYSIRLDDEAMRTSNEDDGEDSLASASIQMDALRQSTFQGIENIVMRVAQRTDDAGNADGKDETNASDFVKILRNAANSCLDSDIYQDTIRVSHQSGSSSKNTKIGDVSSIFDGWAELILAVHHIDGKPTSVVDEFVAGARELHALALLASAQTIIPASVVAGASMTAVLDALAARLTEEGATGGLASAIRAALALMPVDGSICVVRLAAACVASGYALQLIVDDPFLHDDDLRRRFQLFSRTSGEEGGGVADAEATDVDTRQDVPLISADEDEDVHANIDEGSIEDDHEDAEEEDHTDERSLEIELQDGNTDQEEDPQTSSSAHIEDDVDEHAEHEAADVPTFDEDGYDGDKDQGADTAGDMGTSDEPGADSPVTEDLSDVDSIREEGSSEQADDTTKRDSDSHEEENPCSPVPASTPDHGETEDTDSAETMNICSVHEDDATHQRNASSIDIEGSTRDMEDDEECDNPPTEVTSKETPVRHKADDGEGH